MPDPSDLPAMPTPLVELVPLAETEPDPGPLPEIVAHIPAPLAPAPPEPEGTDLPPLPAAVVRPPEPVLAMAERLTLRWDTPVRLDGQRVPAVLDPASATTHWQPPVQGSSRTVLLTVAAHTASLLLPPPLPDHVLHVGRDVLADHIDVQS